MKGRPSAFSAQALWVCGECHTVKAVRFPEVENIPCRVCNGKDWRLVAGSRCDSELIVPGFRAIGCRFEAGHVGLCEPDSED